MSGLVASVAMALIRLCESILPVNNPFLLDGRKTNTKSSKEQAVVDLINRDIYSDPEQKFVSLSLAQLTTALKRILVEIPDAYHMLPAANKACYNVFGELKVRQTITARNIAGTAERGDVVREFNDAMRPLIASISTARVKYFASLQQKELKAVNAEITVQKSEEKLIAKSKGKKKKVCLSCTYI
jgi:hypothetical protein